jgi:hypothetical protein
MRHMAKKPLSVWSEFEGPLPVGPGPYDTDPDMEDTPWFLPAPNDDLDDPASSVPFDPPLINPAAWREAQGVLAAELAQVALRMGLLTARLGGAGEGLRQRLALQEVADLSWWAGDRIGADRLSLWIGLHQGAAGVETMALARSAWAMRRLTGGAAPGEGGWIEGSAAFLGREKNADVADLAQTMEGIVGLHPVVQAAALFQTWRFLGQGPVNDLEAAVMAARHGATMAPAALGAALFLPIAMGGYAALVAQGTPERRLAGWLTGVDLSLRAALALCDRVTAWAARAKQALADLQGSTPRRLVGCLARWPMVTAPLAEAETGASRAAVQRNLSMLLERGLIREVTGQGRYRVWAARDSVSGRSLIASAKS